MKVGGVVESQLKEFDINLIRMNQKILSFYKSNVIDDYTFKPIDSTTLSLYQGGNTVGVDA